MDYRVKGGNLDPGKGTVSVFDLHIDIFENQSLLERLAFYEKDWVSSAKRTLLCSTSCCFLLKQPSFLT